MPISRRRIDEIIEHYFDKPSPIPHSIVVAVPEAGEVSAAFGSLTVLSPIEFTHAMIIACYRDLTKGEQVLEAWKAAMLQTTFSFTKCAGKDEQHFKSKQIRMDLCAIWGFAKLEQRGLVATNWCL